MTATTTQPQPSGLSHLTSASPRRKITDGVARVLVTASVALAILPLGWLVWTLVANGISPILDPDWWLQSERFGGAANAIVGTVIQTLVAALISVPLGVLVAILLIEYADQNSRLVKATTFMVDVLSGVPSIVAALFIFAVWRTTLDLPRSGFVVALALVLLMVPLVVRSTEEMLKIVPHELREASYALGVPKWKTIAQVVLPTAFSGIITGILLGLARVMGETAPLIILAPYSKYLSFDLFSNLMATLPTMINDNRTEVTTAAIDRAWAASLTLILIILVFNLLGRFIARTSKVKA